MKRHLFLLTVVLILTGLVLWRGMHGPAPAPVPATKAPIVAETSESRPEVSPAAPASENRVPIVAKAPPPSAEQQKKAPMPTPPIPPAGGNHLPMPVMSDGPAQRPHAPRVGSPMPWARYEPRFNNRLSDRDFNDALKQVRPENLQPYVNSGAPMVFPAGASFPGLNPGGAPVAAGGGGGMAPAPPTPPASEPVNPFAALFGKFEGTIQPLVEGRAWAVRLSLAGKVEDGKLRGDCTIELTQEGQLVSRVTQNGELSVVQQGPEGSSAIWLKPNDQYYYQLYYRKDRDEWGGNFYRRTDATHIVPEGKVTLHRRPESESAPRTAR